MCGKAHHWNSTLLHAASDVFEWEASQFQEILNSLKRGGVALHEDEDLQGF